MSGVETVTVVEVGAIDQPGEEVMVVMERMGVQQEDVDQDSILTS